MHKHNPIHCILPLTHGRRHRQQRHSRPKGTGDQQFKAFSHKWSARCKEKCQITHFDFLNEFAGVTVEKLTEDLLVLKIPEWSELDFLQKIQSHEKFNNYFRKIELSPVVEANGYSQLAFRFTIRL